MALSDFHERKWSAPSSQLSIDVSDNSYIVRKDRKSRFVFNSMTIQIIRLQVHSFLIRESLLALFHIVLINSGNLPDASDIDNKIREIAEGLSSNEKHPLLSQQVNRVTFVPGKKFQRFVLAEQVFRRGIPRTIYISLPQFTYKKASIPNL